MNSEATRRQRQRDKAAQVKLQRIQRLELRDEIHTLIRIQSEVSTRLDELLQGADSVYEAEVEHCWGVLALSSEDLRDCEDHYMTMAGLEDR